MTSQQDLMALAQRWQDEAAASWGETKEHATLQRCCDELREAATQLGRVEEPVLRWEVRREEDRTFPREYKTEAEADEMVAYVTVNPPATKHPLYIYTRPQLPAGVPEYDRELIAEMLQQFYDALQNNELDWAGRYTGPCIDEQIRLLRAADNRDAEGVHTAMREPPRCPKCGYTNEDCLIHMDHHLCGEPTPPAPQPDNKESR